MILVANLKIPEDGPGQAWQTQLLLTAVLTGKPLVKGIPLYREIPL